MLLVRDGRVERDGDPASVIDHYRTRRVHEPLDLDDAWPDPGSDGNEPNDATRELGGTLGVAVVGSLFSSLYAAGGVGFGAAGLIVAGLLESVGIRTALIACIALAGAAALIGAIGEDVLAETKARSVET